MKKYSNLLMLIFFWAAFAVWYIAAAAYFYFIAENNIGASIFLLIWFLTTLCTAIAGYLMHRTGYLWEK